jgi:hypothetical protein
MPPVGPFQVHRAAAFTPAGVQTIPLTLGADVDLTLPAGQTKGVMARAILIGNTGGNLEYFDGSGKGPYTKALAANERFDQLVSYVVKSGTTASTVSAML